MLKHLSIILLALGSLSWFGPGSEDLDTLRSEAVAQLVEDLDDLAQWCNKKKLYASRNEVYQSVLTFDTDHANARRFLGFRRTGSGAWEDDGKRKSPKDRNKSALAELPTRRSAVVAKFRDRMVALLEQASIDPKSSQGRALLAEVLVADENDAVVRELMGEVRLDDRWVLEDTMIAKERRAEIRKWVKDAARASAKAVAAIEPTETELKLVERWAATLGTPEVRVLATTSEKEARKICRAAHSVGAFFRSAFGTSTEPWEGFTVYVLPNDGERQQFLANYPDLTADERDNLLNFTSAGLPYSANVANWDDDEVRRLDAVTRHTVSLYLAAAYGVTTGEGWVWEGFGLYLTRELVGTRLTWYAGELESASDANSELRALLLVDGTPWMTEAHKLMKGAKAGSLGGLLDKSISQMDAGDLLIGYSFAAFLLEAHSAELGQILARIGQGPRGTKKRPREEPSVVVPEVLGTDLVELEARLVRWQSERRR